MRLSVGGVVLDADFDVVDLDGRGNIGIILESRGGSFRNVDYSHNLLVLLHALCDYRATVTSITASAVDINGKLVLIPEHD
jgi:hypothetical protein